MIYLDNGATSYPKIPAVSEAILQAMETCANPGRGGHRLSMAAMETVYRCREEAGRLFDCLPEQVVFTCNCTHGLNIAIRTLVKPGSQVVISGFEHNAVTRPLHLLGAKTVVAGRKLFDPADTLWEFEKALKNGVAAAVFTHVSNVFGYILPVEEMAMLCRKHHVPFIVDAAQSAGMLPVTLGKWGADFIAMPGHKGLLGPMGTGILLCGRTPEPLLAGGTGSASRLQEMPGEIPDRAEPGTLNVPGIAGLTAGLRCVQTMGIERIFQKEQGLAQKCAKMLRRQGFRVFAGKEQGGTVSFLPATDCEVLAQLLGEKDIAVRAGLHCAPLAHESAGTIESGTVRISFGHLSGDFQIGMLERAMQEIKFAQKQNFL